MHSPAVANGLLTSFRGVVPPQKSKEKYNKVIQEEFKSTEDEFVVNQAGTLGRLQVQNAILRCGPRRVRLTPRSGSSVTLMRS